jgi:outer membrane lipoprotein-sorting protein
MPKFLSEMVVAVMLVSLSSTVGAQTPTSTPRPTPTPTTPSVKPTATTPNLKLLTKAIGIFWQGNRAQTDSQIVMTIQRPGKNISPIQINATIKTIAQTDDRFRAELILSRSGSPNKIAYSIVCDGQNVWIYRPDKRQYSQTTFSEFKPQTYSLLVGLSTVFFVSAPESGRKTVVTDIAAGRDPFKSIPAELIANLKTNVRQVDGQNLQAYILDNPSSKISFSGLIQPETGVLKQIEFANTTETGDIKIVEKIMTHTTTTNPNKQTFRFSPPPGVKKVQSVDKDLRQLFQ